ncbi:MAG: DUF1566 domain-containing protein [Bacteroidales bacterium]|nr:DUF1566 domain-containing protein [Bacteroidales bacterium]
MQLKQGTLLQGGKYRIEKVLGQGGFGITYLACQTGLNRKVAVKEFFMQEYCNRDAGTSRVSVPSMGSRELVERYRQKFLKEARLIASFDNNNIIKIYDVFEDNSTAYYVMEYLEGKSLKAVLEECGPLPEDLALKYIRQISLALAEVHASNLLHLDVKPANIMLNKKGEAVLIDFGISKHYDEGGKQTSSALAGTSEGYAPLEQYEAGALDSFAPATDIYALGATLFCLLAGMRPPKASEVMNHGLPELPLDISSAVREVVTAAMQPMVRMRPQSVEEFLSLLESTDNREQSTNNRVQSTSAKAFKAANEETRALEKEMKQPTVKNSEPTPPKKNCIGLVAVVVLVGVLIGCGLFFAFPGSDSCDDISTELKVDLGLSVCWAGWNAGASSPEGYGGYYAWGEITTKPRYTKDNSSTHGKSMGCIVGNSAYDVARAQWGGSWRMPTAAEFQELIDRCTWTWATYNGVNGYKVTGPNGKSIFLPAAGRFGSSLLNRGTYGDYWSATPDESNSFSAYYLNFGSDYHYTSWDDRCNGCSVRPVCDK